LIVLDEHEKYLGQSLFYQRSKDAKFMIESFANKIIYYAAIATKNAQD